jgi:hypothetical protein
MKAEIQAEIQYWVERAEEMEDAARAARSVADSKPSISVQDLVTYDHRLVPFNGKIYEVHVKELEFSK